jgi:translation elongation factor EF-1beta
MCFSYRLRFKSSAKICREIEDTASDANKKIKSIYGISKEVNSLIQDIKKIRISLGKLKAQAETPEKKTRFLIDLSKKDADKLSSLNSEVLEKSGNMLSLIKLTADNLDRISFDVSSLLYREDRRLTLLVERLIQRGKYHKLIFRLNMLKGQIKIAALRLFESAKLDHKTAFMHIPSETEAVAFGEKLMQLSVKVWDAEKALETEEGMKSIDSLIRESKSELDYLKGLEMDILDMMPEIEHIVFHLENETYLFEEKTSARIKQLIFSSKEHIKRTKEDIAERSQDLFKEIEMIPESK